ncbi:hypothetical protein [Streptomyces anthocyanicus]|uniref:hypothetical protein n=1 Tax=Streptomyces anthocyanicus TaxID=68174 RepID=UPI0038703DFD|nr:hypothetical protein OH747_05675 [Streptomyces anthocyanicus]
MTAGQLDTVINAYVWADTQIATFGPGVILAVAFRLVWRGTWRALDRIAAARETVTRSRNQATPDTQPGTDQNALHTCTAIWNTSHRKEKP